ncbi:hypothetical protein [Desulfitobacterium sp. AusDCA]|uniref:hypothetical protein n=1 Tax=Desulfitobacterium sp. AusDCA TaxID=3240383 RepID=UPI003DA78485
MKKRCPSEKEAGFATQPLLFALLFFLFIATAGGYGIAEYRTSHIKGILDQTASRVADAMKVNGVVTQNDQINIAGYLTTNGLDPSRVYFKASTSRQAYGSSAGNGVIGYNYEIKIPWLNLPVYNQYIESPVPNVLSTYVSGMSSDTSSESQTFSLFGGSQNPNPDLGSIPVTDVTNPGYPTAVTLTGPSTATVGSSTQFSGTVSMGSTSAPAGTEVTLSTPNGLMTILTKADGTFSTVITFPSVGPQIITAKSGIGTVSQSVTVAAGSPASITFTNAQ